MDDLIKKNSLDVLLKTVIVEAEGGTIVLPVQCPGIGRVDDYGKMENGRPACVFHNKNCPYFGEAGFNLSDFYKQISCNIGAN